jgi:D-arabinose 1-dehydrogenase-like Zn-dependent alcohol dehydrogenase
MNMKMKAAQISKPGGEWELVGRDIPEPGAGQVRVKVEACGICHSDVFVKEVSGPGFSTLVCRDMKLGDVSMQTAAT